MVTGDARSTAASVARDLGIDDLEAEALPDRKAEVVARLQREGRVVAAVGDGVNDAPALARADVGVAMGSGADVAVESAGVDLHRRAISPRSSAPSGLSCATMAQHPAKPLLRLRVQRRRHSPRRRRALPPLRLAPEPDDRQALAMSLSSVSVIANALRLRRVAL